MSKAPKNIEKILLGAGLVVGGTLAAFGIMKNLSVSKDFGASFGHPSNADTSVPLATDLSGVLNTSASKMEVPSATVSAPNLEGGLRPVDLYIGPALYAHRDSPNSPVDPVTAENLHPPIPNAWWLKYGAKLNYADSPNRDDDNDGFTNLEEFKGNTDPTNASKHPPLIAKLSYVTDESFRWVILTGFPSQGVISPKLEAGDPALTPPVKLKTGFDKPVKEGDIFFEEGDERFVKRFKFLGLEDRDVRNERLNIDQKVTFAKYEDQKDNKQGLIYEFPTSIPRAEREAQSQYDRVAVLDLRALGFAGQDFKVEERRSFSLPPDAEEKDYFLKEVTPAKIVVEWKDGDETRTVEIPKGQMPEFTLGE